MKFFSYLFLAISLYLAYYTFSISLFMPDAHLMRSLAGFFLVMGLIVKGVCN